jgi:choline-sulfatase
VVGEYLAEGVRSPEVMIRRGAHKYLHAHGDPDRLFDLDADPHELENLADRAEHAPLVEAFRAEVGRRWDLPELEREVLASQRRRRIVSAALAHGAHTPWDFQPHTDASAQWVRGADADRERPWRLRPRGGIPEE